MNKNPTTRSLTIALTLFAIPAIGFAADAKENWKNMCAKCHGPDGTGQTTMGKKLKLKDYTDAKVQAGMTDAEILTAITDGVAKDGKNLMSGFKDKVSADEAKALVGVVRGFKK